MRKFLKDAYTFTKAKKIDNYFSAYHLEIIFLVLKRMYRH